VEAFSRNMQVSNFMEICRKGVELFHVEGQAGRQAGRHEPKHVAETFSISIKIIILKQVVFVVTTVLEGVKLMQT
jgi:hypothetical protein